MSELLLVIENNLAGRIRADTGGELALEYEASWRKLADSHCVSVSMPLAQTAHTQKAVLPYLWNLLPENPAVLQRWAQQYHVSASNPFKMLANVGEDVPGAVQFVSDEQFQAMQAARRPVIDWLDSDELAERLRQLRADVAAVRRPGDIGKMSLPGAQAKTAFYRDERRNRWGIPSGRMPTTHIIKPCVPGFDGLVENEYLCQNIAARLGLPAAHSTVLSLDQTYIVVERYDRLPPQPGSAFIRRVHQEDMCQALGLMPGRKYQEEGGPGVPQIVTLIRRVSAEPDTDVERFLRANMFNWFIGGTDAHAKNYSLLIAGGDEVRLAPLYDLSSQLPYPELIEQRMAMKIGDYHEIKRIGLAQWRKLALACALDEGQVLTALNDMARALPDEISAARDQALAEGLSRKIVTSLARQLVAHVQERLDAITTIRRAPTRRRD